MQCQMKKHNHYEAAFEAFIQYLHLPCLATQERRRSLVEENSEMKLKNMDFIISSKQILPPMEWCLSERENSEENFFPKDGTDAVPHSSSFSSPAPSPASSPAPAPSPASERIIIPASANSWLCDVKGRRFPSGQKSPQYWRNWISKDDLVSLARWENLFGAGFHGLFVFVYDVWGTRLPLPEERLFSFGGRRYGFFVVPLATYMENCRELSPRWETVTMSTALFRRCAVPLDEFFGCKYLSQNS